MKKAADLRTPLSRVRGLGAARSSTHHWWIERMTSLALIPLSVWFLIGLISHLGVSRETAAAWLSQPFTSITFAALMFVTFIHAKMGLQVIIDDYVHTEWRKHALVVFKDTCIYALALATLFAIMKLYFSGIN